MKLIIQIPCFNEEATLPATLADLPREVAGFDTVEWLVIDDGSTDRTVAVAEEHGVDHVVSHVRNRGLAAAYLTGLNAALEAGADVIVNTDADNQYDGSCIADLVRPVLDEAYDLVVGERPIESVDEFSGLKKRLQRVGSWVVRRFSGTPVRDAASGFRAMSAEAALRLQVFGRYTYTMETLIQAGWEGLAVTSVPIRVNAGHAAVAPRAQHPAVRARARRRRSSAASSCTARSASSPTSARSRSRSALVLLLRWLGYFLFADEYESRVPGLIAGIASVLVAIQIWAVGFVADLQAANRRLLSSVRYEQRRRALGLGSPPRPQRRGADPEHPLAS